jgi:hypothetical protein
MILLDGSCFLLLGLCINPPLGDNSDPSPSSLPHRQTASYLLASHSIRMETMAMQQSFDAKDKQEVSAIAFPLDHAKTTSRDAVHGVSNLRFKIASSTSLFRAQPLLYFAYDQSPDWTTPAVTTLPGVSCWQCYTSLFDPTSSAFVCRPHSIFILYHVILMLKQLLL